MATGPDVDDVRAQVQQRVARADFIEKLAERVGGQAHVSAVFGEPVSRGELTVIPVARARWGVGGGSGEKAGERGLGGGGGALVAPVGYIEVRESGAEFKPIRDSRAVVGAGVAAAGLAALAARAVLGRR